MSNHRQHRFALAVCLWVLGGAANLFAQTTAFNYQGILNFEGKPITGYYDFLFDLYTAETGGSHAGTLVSLTAVPVNDGKFHAVLDFGTSAFDGTARWIEVAVRTNGAGNYSYLSPRQPVLSVPYAVQAKISENAKTAQNAQTATTAGPNAVATASIQDSAVTAPKIAVGQVVKSLNGLTDGVTIQAGQNVTITPNGNDLAIAATNVWGTTGNAGTTPGANFIGTTDNQLLMIKASKVGVGTANPKSELDVAGTITANAFAGDGSALTGVLTLGGNAKMADHTLWLRGGSTNSGIGWFAWFAGSYLDGPAVFGNNGGALGTTAGTPRAALQWGTESLRLLTNTWLEGHDLYFGSFGDSPNSLAGLGLYDETHGKPFGNIPMRGPVLYGYNEGGLATTAGQRRLELRWNDLGQVIIPGDLVLDGATWLENTDLSLKPVGDSSAGLGWYGTSSVSTPKLFGTHVVDGPVLYGWNGGALGTKYDHKLALTWDNKGNDNPRVLVPGDLLFNGTAWLEDGDLVFRTQELDDRSSGLGWYGATGRSTPKKFGTNDFDGPILYGGRQGALATIVGHTLALKWDETGDVDIAGQLTAKNMPVVGRDRWPDGQALAYDPSGPHTIAVYLVKAPSAGRILAIGTAQVHSNAADFELGFAENEMSHLPAMDLGLVGPSQSGIMTVLQVRDVAAGDMTTFALRANPILGTASVSEVNIAVMFFPGDLPNLQPH